MATTLTPIKTENWKTALRYAQQRRCDLISGAVSNDDSLLLLIINKTLSNISQAEHHQIHQNWSRVTLQQSVDYRWVWQLLGVIAILLIGILVWNGLLKRKVKINTATL